MKRVLMQCAGAAVPLKVRREPWDVTQSISHHGTSPDLNISIEAPRAAFDRIDGRGADLLLIAAYVFASDQQVRRGGAADVYGDDWRRHFTLYIPVNDVDFWRQPSVSGSLQSALSFVSDDRWTFEFERQRAGEPRGQIPLLFDSNQSLGEPDLVSLISGGLDSLCAVVEEVVEQARHPVLVGHSSGLHLGPRQRDLCRRLRRAIPAWSFPYVSGAVHRSHAYDAPETTQRTRSFLYSVLGALVANYLGLREVHLADNGIVSLNFPISHQVMGAQATRSTHPRFFRLMNELLREVFPDGPQISNPLWARTRPEVLDVLKRTGTCDLIPATNSCAHQRNRTRTQPYCGVCSQCIDRRYGMIASGLEDYDPVAAYEVDAFTHALPEGVKRTMAYGYYRFASETAEIDDDELAIRYPLAECIDPFDPRQGEVARELVAMVRRHAYRVVHVTEHMLAAKAGDLARQRLPESSLLALVASQRSDPVSRTKAVESDATGNDFQHSPDYASVRLRGRAYTLTPCAALVVRELHRAAKAGLPDLSWPTLQSSLTSAKCYQRKVSDVFRTIPGWSLLVVSPRRGSYRLNLPPAA